jgi:hypothetical protein
MTIYLRSTQKEGVAAVAYPGTFSQGVQQIQLRAEGIVNGDLGAVAP